MVEESGNKSAKLVCCCRKIFACSAIVRLVFSLLNSGFGDQQEQSLQDYIEASVMLRYNKR